MKLIVSQRCNTYILALLSPIYTKYEMDYSEENKRTAYILYIL